MILTYLSHSTVAPDFRSRFFVEPLHRWINAWITFIQTSVVPRSNLNIWSGAVGKLQLFMMLQKVDQINKLASHDRNATVVISLLRPWFRKRPLIALAARKRYVRDWLHLLGIQTLDSGRRANFMHQNSVVAAIVYPTSIISCRFIHFYP